MSSDEMVTVTFNAGPGGAEYAAELIRRVVRASGGVGSHTLGRIAEALEAQVKPAEPTGLGAVVEDANGSQYVRLATKDDAPWHLQPEGPIGFNAHPYHEIDAVRVLSEGVQP